MFLGLKGVPHCAVLTADYQNSLQPLDAAGDGPKTIHPRSLSAAFSVASKFVQHGQTTPSASL
jgi:hypothetical protein